MVDLRRWLGRCPQFLVVEFSTLTFSLGATGGASGSPSWEGVCPNGSGVPSGVGVVPGCAMPGKGDPALSLTPIPMSHFPAPETTEPFPTAPIHMSLTRTVQEAFQEDILKNFAMFAAVNGLRITHGYEEQLRAALVGWSLCVDFRPDGFSLRIGTADGSVVNQSFTA